MGLEVTTLRGGTDASGRPLAAAEGTEEKIMAALDGKERKVFGYRTFAQEIWCGLGILGIQGSSVFSVPTALRSGSFRSSFDRVYVVSVVPEQVVKLDVSRRGTVEQH